MSDLGDVIMILKRKKALSEEPFGVPEFTAYLAKGTFRPCSLLPTLALKFPSFTAA